MEVSECTKIVLDRIQNIEPEIATKIIGYLLLNHTNEEIMEYAFGSEEQIHSLVNDAKLYLASSPKPVVSGLIQPDQYLPSQAFSRTFSSPSSFRVPAPYSSPHNSPDFLPSSYNHLSRALSERRELAALEEQLHGLNPLGLDFSSNCFGGGLGFSASGLRSPTGLPEFPKACHYFYKGYCRHGNYCKFFHGQPAADNFLQMYGLSPNELLNDDHLFSRLSLEQLEVEISELLKARNGMPVSIASLPSMYLEMYGKTLQADGYLTESQRHGKVGFSLTRLLARLNRIRLIDRPHGQHAVVLAEDAPKYEYRNERNDPGLSSSHQIYLTFPAESSFTDEDVAKYFEQFGPVRDVRIPRQEKRMFGFVSFMYPQTVREILAKGHPHIIRGSRVLVKPYKEKAKCWDRTFTQRAGFPVCFPQCFEMEPELPTSLSVPQGYETASFLKTQLIEEQENALELERRRLIELQLNSTQLASHSFFNYGMEQLKSPADRFSTLPVQDNGCSSDDKPQQTEQNFSAQDSSHIELPDSPFASPRLGNMI